MTFATQRGTDGAADSFLGTTGEDVLLLQNQQDAAFVSGRQDDDTVTLTSFQLLVSNQTLRGGAGNDTVNVLNATNVNASFIAQDEGNDAITLNAVSSSTVQGNDGNDVLTTTGLVTSAIVNGNAGNDTLNVNGAAAAGLIYGGIGFDNINVNSNTSSGTKVQGNEEADTIQLTAGQDIQNSTINGNQGNDTILVQNLAGFGASTIYGGSGNDTVNAGAAAADNLNIQTNDGNDNVLSGTGNDTIVSSAGNDTINAGVGANSISAIGGNSIINTTAAAGGINSNDTIAVGAGNDTVNAGNSTVARITAVAGNNSMTSGGGADSITGGGGLDTIVGNAGNDALLGGASADVFSYSNAGAAALGAALTATRVEVTARVGADTITDFNIAQGDTLDVSRATFGTTSTGAVGGLGAGRISLIANQGTAIGVNFNAGGFVYDQGADQLFFNSGNNDTAVTLTASLAAGNSILIGTFGAGTALTNAQINVVA